MGRARRAARRARYRPAALRSADREGDLETPSLAADQPHVARERKLAAKVARLRGKGDQILEVRKRKRRRARRRLSMTGERLVRWGERGARRAARGIGPRRFEA